MSRMFRLLLLTVWKKLQHIDYFVVFFNTHFGPRPLSGKVYCLLLLFWNSPPSPQNFSTATTDSRLNTHWNKSHWKNSFFSRLRMNVGKNRCQLCWALLLNPFQVVTLTLTLSPPCPPPSFTFSQWLLFSFTWSLTRGTSCLPGGRWGLSLYWKGCSDWSISGYLRDTGHWWLVVWALVWPCTCSPRMCMWMNTCP